MYKYINSIINLARTTAREKKSRRFAGNKYENSMTLKYTIFKYWL